MTQSEMALTSHCTCVRPRRPSALRSSPPPLKETLEEQRAPPNVKAYKNIENTDGMMVRTALLSLTNLREIQKRTRGGRRRHGYTRRRLRFCTGGGGGGRRSTSVASLRSSLASSAAFCF